MVCEGEEDLRSDGQRDNITEWTDVTLCEAVRLSRHNALWSKIVFGPNRYNPNQGRGHEEEEEKEEDSSLSVTPW